MFGWERHFKWPILSSISVRSLFLWAVRRRPNNCLDPAVYPYFDIYPGYPATSQVDDNKIEVDGMHYFCLVVTDESSFFSSTEKAAMVSLTPVLPPIYPSFNLCKSLFHDH